MKNEYLALVEEFKKICKALREEEKLRTPLIYPLKSNAEQIIELLENTKIVDKQFLNWKFWNIQNLKILISDLPGELQHDYDKENRRYRSKWVIQKRKIEGTINGFKSQFKSYTIAN
ncbi:hypothetical protein OAE12_00645 [bacterium]|nr:hypothetical protein [bacterium]